jgi:hypothetical protein
VPRLHALAAGEHQVELIARDPVAAARSDDPGSHVSVTGLEVRTVASFPTVIEGGDPVAKLPAGPGTPSGAGQLGQSALRILAAERRGGGVAAALGGSRIVPIQLGNLNVRGRRIGATMHVDLFPAPQNVSATVPAFIPGDPRARVPYALQTVRMRVAVLRDALIDIDVGRRRVIAIEPGPRSHALQWSPSKEPAPSGAADED